MRIEFIPTKYKENKILLTEKILDFIDNQLYEKLNQFRHNISKVKIRLEDINGPYEAGLDKACKIEAYVPFLEKKISADHIDLTVHNSIEKATEKLAQKVQAKIKNWEKRIAKKYSSYIWCSVGSLRF